MSIATLIPIRCNLLCRTDTGKTRLFFRNGIAGTRGACSSGNGVKHCHQITGVLWQSLDRIPREHPMHNHVPALTLATSEKRAVPHRDPCTQTTEFQVFDAASLKYMSVMCAFPSFQRVS